MFSDPNSQTIFYFYNILMMGLTFFIIFAYADTVFLKVGLYDRAPTPDKIIFNKDDDRLFFNGGTTQILGDQSSMQQSYNPLGYDSVQLFGSTN